MPYAAPPVGALRWRPPAALTSWSGTRDATQFAQPCIQLDSDTTTVGSEDCLYLNVFVPSSASARSNLPVMVHLHPGGNFFGVPYEDAPAFTDRGVIVVTVAYRLGVFGFTGLPGLTREQGASGEYGNLDQLAALRWVHDNITAFGGNPANVTLFGSSAGSFDTAALMASPLSQGLIARAAVQGDSYWSVTGQYSTVKDAEFAGTLLAQRVGCSSAADVVACMRALPADRLVIANGPGDVGPTVGGTVLPKPVIQLVAERSTVPLLIGFDREEDSGGFYPFQDETQSAYEHDTLAIFGPDNAQQGRSLYPPGSYDSLLWSVIAAQTDAVRGCSTRRLANTVHAPVWRYLYTHRYEDDPFWSQFRASHVLEDPFLWGYDPFGLDPAHTMTAAEQAFAAQLTSYWTNFAKTGNPNGTGLPAWPRYNTSTEPMITLDDQIGTTTNYHDMQCAFIDALQPFPPPWAPGKGPPRHDPWGFIRGHARAIP